MESKYISSSPNQTNVKPENIHPVTPDEFLPSIGRWITLGGFGLLALFGVALALSSVLKYKVTVKAPGIVRPVGGLRLVQTHTQGIIRDILVEPNQLVEKGDALAIIDDLNFQTKKSQLEGNIRQNQLQLDEIKIQITDLDNQMKAEKDRLNQTLVGAKAELSLQENNYHTQKMTSVAELHEAQAALDLAEEELARYQKLAGTGVISALKLKEKETAYQTAAARLEKIQAHLHPSTAEIAIAKAKISQEKATGESTLIGLHKEREQLIRQQLEFQSQIDNDKQALHEIDAQIEETIVKAPASGIIQNLTLHNISQFVNTGDVIAEIAPSNTPLQIKALVASQDIARVETGQKVQMQVSACPYPDYGTLEGTVKAISPDAIAAQANPASAPSNTLIARVQNSNTYEVTIVPKNPVLSLGKQNCKIQSGMEGKADIITKEETVLKFLLRKARLITDIS